MRANHPPSPLPRQQPPAAPARPTWRAVQRLLLLQPSGTGSYSPDELLELLRLPCPEWNGAAWPAAADGSGSGGGGSAGAASVAASGALLKPKAGRRRTLTSPLTSPQAQPPLGDSSAAGEGTDALVRPPPVYSPWYRLPGEPQSGGGGAVGGPPVMALASGPGPDPRPPPPPSSYCKEALLRALLPGEHCSSGGEDEFEPGAATRTAAAVAAPAPAAAAAAMAGAPGAEVQAEADAMANVLGRVVDDALRQPPRWTLRQWAQLLHLAAALTAVRAEASAAAAPTPAAAGTRVRPSDADTGVEVRRAPLTQGSPNVASVAAACGPCMPCGQHRAVCVVSVPKTRMRVVHAVRKGCASSRPSCTSQRTMHGVRGRTMGLSAAP